ncbi:alanine--tRNA ligase [Faecalibacterium prausnitzii]|uniref:Alanine--tRNA ligase n=1 Tax=Faecalibacterium prausnitzii TaxID=853 RepID=A0A6A8KFW0_9FIRM|nr:alanine--tRNA ligase [Faecalibacterium prausnitzii]MSC45797.1 alanine--tRNA ligase [Faecalibacterium prausnitzii]MSC48937.1 alanine--tRNA ligase [Faecalibacterium prausnitzii]MSC68841.1 alanine--tRNA ligase [Faecalibacterium prausnitzii]MSC75034.1 alanine--tRNA ligase [Faecalibacterium prausnitzii]MSC80633.1 alanine--tRNA ligase [Faecalibacterium prausnitzii]
MQWTGLNELREKYLSFFESKGHLRLDSFPLVPKNDPSLLLINSGMAPMKKWFLAQEEPPRHRVTTCQKCIRTPDIERVGITARHGTFFEMLGNFSFQDYFKDEVIPWAWEFLTSDEWMAIPKDRLHISVYEEDDEAYDIWTKKVGIAPDHMVRLGKEDNFWEHGSGPCGPCSEIYFDRGPEYGCGKPTCGVGCDCDRYMEIWNLVFSQFDADGKGHYERLARPNIDTGMGLERLACVMQNVGNLFEVDTVQSVLHHVEHIAGKTYKQDPKTDISIRVITDHIRSCTFMVSDGILPSNEGRGYVLRRLLRRAARHGRMLGIDHPFLVDLVETVIQSSESAYPELREHDAYIKKVIGTEEANFARTIDAGMNILNNMIDRLEKAHQKLLSGMDAFKLNDTFGFPLDLTKEIAAEQGLEIDEDGFHAEMKKQKERARAERLKKNISGWSEDLFGALEAEPTVFTGYDTLTDKGTVVALSDEETLTDAIATDEEAKDSVLVVLDKTPFYAEMGGQAADHGVLNGAECSLRVLDVKKTPKGYYVHTCVLESGIVKVGDVLTAQVDKGYRMAIARNHTATHLLQAALREVLGDHVHQAGSYQDASITHFDFTHFSAVTPEELARVQKIVNDKIFDSMNVTVQEMPVEEAKKLGAMALFGEKYGKVVRVVDIEGWSTEFCGGTHVKNTAQIGGFKIVSESSVAAGIRRIEAVTGRNLLIRANLQEAMLHDVANTLKANNVAALPARAEAVMAENKAMSRELEEMKAKIAASKVDSLFDNAEEADGVKIASAYFTGTTGDTLRGMCDSIRDKAVNPVVAVLVGKAEDKITMAVTVNKLAQEKGLKAGVLVKELSAIAGGKGGGKPDFAMAGLKDETKIDEVLASVSAIVKKALG